MPVRRIVPWLAVATLILVAARPPVEAVQRGGAVPQAQRKIAPWVVEQTASGREAEFLVILADSADLAPARTLRDKTAKGRFVRDALFATATRSQAPLVEWLRDRNIPHRAFYIVNAIWVRASRQVALEIAARPDVARVEGNPRIRNLDPPPAAARQAPQDRPASPDSVELGVTYIRAPEVWSQGFTGQGIVVAGADTGIQWDHPALENHYRGWNGSSANHNYNWHDSVHSGGGTCGFDTTAPCDDFGHGTHTVGTAVGSDGGTNQIGVAPGATFIGCRNMDVGNGTPSTYMECMEWFLAPYPIGGNTSQGDASKAPDVTINSWGCPPSEGCSALTLQAAAEAQRAAGIMTVSSAGNSGPSCSTVKDPQSLYDAVYTVGAIDAFDGSIASFSSRGPVTIDGSGRMKPDITAPGIFVRSSIPGSTYGFKDGTSMASPHVAGAVALLWSARPALKHMIDDTEAMLNGSAVAVSNATCGGTVPNNVFGAGRLDVKVAVDLGALAVTGVLPHAGRVSGGQTLTLNGAFANLSTVSIGGVGVSWSYNGGPASITFTTPAHAVGAADVALSPTTGGTFTKANVFAYLPTTFTDDALVVGVTVVKAQHILEIRAAIDALRAVAGLGPTTWTDLSLTPTATPIKAAHILELRTTLEAVAAILGLSSGSYTDPSLAPGFPIKRVHLEELRQRIRDIAG